MVKLARMSGEHLEATWNWLRDPLMRLEVDCLGKPSHEENQSYWQNHWNNESREDYAILDLKGNHIGNCGLKDIDLNRRKAELWIYLGEKKRSGNGSAAVKKLLSRGFDQLKLNRISVRVLSSNPVAMRFFSSLGFVEEGRFREDSRHDGAFVDSIWFSILAQEYRKKES